MGQDEFKRAAAEAAVEQVTDGMIVGLGTGSTAAFALEALGRRVREGLRIIGIPTSDRAAQQAGRLGIPLSTLGERAHIDVTIDGADEIETGSLNLIKGRGGALLREKIVASASRRLVIIADYTKLVEVLGVHTPVPVEVARFGWQATARKLRELGATPALRQDPGGEPFTTDNGNYIVDCDFGPMRSAGAVARDLDGIAGVVEHGLFVGMTSEVYVGAAEGVRSYRGQSPA